MESYGLGLSNLTALDPGHPGIVSQKNAFTVINFSLPGCACEELEESENIKVKDFHFIFIRKRLRYRLLYWLARKIA